MKTDRLKKKRIQKGYSVPALAKELGISKSTLYRYENGDIEKMPSDRLKEVARILNTSPEYLMYWSNSDRPQHYDTLESFKVARPLRAAERKHIQDYIDSFITKK